MTTSKRLITPNMRSRNVGAPALPATSPQGIGAGRDTGGIVTSPLDGLGFSAVGWIKSEIVTRPHAKRKSSRASNTISD